ncbi:hypothetical protein ACFFWC_21115 [Plantactinospora siamensis]|uniref:Uncharacterized protein n=1 Tax=Plantactinospora siamensis TaxID=555372 RepID=A0ABV6NS87_9ACTN
MGDHPSMPRHYLPPGTPLPPDTPQRLDTPRPGHGTIFVHLKDIGTSTPEIVWAASWQDPFESPGPNGEPAGIEEVEGTREDVLAWVRRRPAAAFYLLSEPGPVPLPDRDDDVVLDATRLERPRPCRFGE